MDKVKALADLLRLHKPVAVLTGAGISTESGLPDFRSPGTGVYASIDPMEHLSVDALTDRPAQFWDCFGTLFAPAADVLPNRGHIALAKLEEGGYINVVITQNIDGLHTAAGSRRVIEIHGHLRTCHCQACVRSYPLSQVLSQLDAAPVPLCPVCAGVLRPDVVLFGDMMPECYADAVSAVESAGLLLVVGSSLTVWPANTLAFSARRLVVINREPTPGDARACAVIRVEAGEALTALADELSPA